jgi:luciferase family oxidoreductase group 1
MIQLSVLDLAPIVEGSDAAASLRNSMDLARHVERLGFRRFWMAEHHGMPGIASAATAVALAYVGTGTSSIRLGAGGVMLPNHAPLAIAEQFGTLASLYPGRIDLGLGRAPGSDQATARAMRRNLAADENQFPRDVVELMNYFQPTQPLPVRAVPGEGLDIPIWILGSSLFGAQLAALLGLPFAFASHFAPAQMMEALQLYRGEFRPSAQLQQPYVMLGFNVLAADSDAEAQFLSTSLLQSFANLRAGRPSLVPPPLEGFEASLDPPQRAMLDHMLTASAIGSPETVRESLEAFVDRTDADELIVATHVFEHAHRLRSFEILAELFPQAKQAELEKTDG